MDLFSNFVHRPGFPHISKFPLSYACPGPDCQRHVKQVGRTPADNHLCHPRSPQISPKSLTNRSLVYPKRAAGAGVGVGMLRGGEDSPT